MGKAGIYLYNGIFYKALDLEKKLKRRKGAIIIEEYDGDLTEPKDLEFILQKLLDKHNKITTVKETNDLPLKYYWYNPETRYTLVTIKEDRQELPWIKFTINDTQLTFEQPVNLSDKFLGRNIIKVNDNEYSIQ